MAKPRVIAFIVREFKEMIPPTLFFLVGFNLIVLTTQLLVANQLPDFLFRLASFLVATTAALIVGKSVLVANHLAFLRRYDTAPLIQPILFRTIVYSMIVTLVRFLEKLVHYFAGGGSLEAFPAYFADNFVWSRFFAIQIWIFVLFLIYTTFNELNELFGQGELHKSLFKRRSSEVKLTRRERLRALVRLNDLTKAHGVGELRNPGSAAHDEMVRLLEGLAAKKSP
ncbi:MAG: hypothetical protein ACREFM_19725 [Hypericibacter sp.]